MDPDFLSDHLAKLHEDLKNVQGVDPRSNQLLSEVLKDIQRLLEKSPGVATPGVAISAPPTPGATTPPDPAPAAAASLASRLENVAVQFEADHPTLAASSRRLIDLLGNAGL